MRHTYLAQSNVRRLTHGLPICVTFVLHDYINAYGVITTALLPIVDGGDVHRCWRQTSATATGVTTGDVFGHQTRPHVTDAGVYTIRLHSRPNTRALHNFNGQTSNTTPGN